MQKVLIIAINPDFLILLKKISAQIILFIFVSCMSCGEELLDY